MRQAARRLEQQGLAENFVHVDDELFALQSVFQTF
jgi:hypothetical protein